MRQVILAGSGIDAKQKMRPTRWRLNHREAELIELERGGAATATYWHAKSAGGNPQWSAAKLNDLTVEIDQRGSIHDSR